MPKWMRHYLTRKNLWQHFQICLVGGLIARLLCAFFVYGPQALDDYKHGVWPAYQMFAGLPIDLPDYRSYLLLWVLAGFIKVGSVFGLSSALAQVRVMYIGLGLISLLGIYGTYLFVRNFKSKLFSSLALYMVAFFPLMPFVGTRAFGEAIAMSLVMLAFGVLESARRTSNQKIWPWFLGFAILGVATLFRFHVGLLYVTYGAILIGLKVWPGVIGGLAGGVFSIVAEVAVDLLSGKAPFGTLLSYLAENEGGAVDYGVSPWYNTWSFILVLSLAPFSFVFARKLPQLWRKHWPWIVPFLVYVFIHSLVPHKEERFLYPVVGIEFWAIAYLWSSSAFFKWSRKIYSPVMIGLGVPGLLVACFVNTQEGEIEPPAYAESHYHQVMYLDHQSLFGLSRIQFYFLRPPSVLEQVQRESFNAHKIDETFESHPDFKAVVLLTSVPDVRDQLHALEGMKTMSTQCHEMRTSGSIIDRLIYSLNPRHNERRRPTWYLVCEKG